MVYKKAETIDEISTVDLTLCSKCQIDDEDFVNFCGFLDNMNYNDLSNLSFSGVFSIVILWVLSVGKIFI